MAFVTDRTSIETDEKCGMRRFWFLHAAGNGIVPAQEAPALKLGIEIHEAFAAVLDPSSRWVTRWGLDPVQDQEEMERMAWVVGMTAAFRDVIVPEWMTPFYDIVAVEKEMVLERPQLWLAFTADLILRQKHAPNKLVVIDYKSVSRITKSWTESWPFAIQMHLNQLGVEEELEEPVSHALVMGLDKGYWADGKIRHPYIWAYSDGASHWQPDYKKGLTLRPTWEYGSMGPDGVEEWVTHLGPEVAKGLFPMSVPIVLDRQEAERVLLDRTWREAQVEAHFDTEPDPLDPETGSHRVVFPRNRTQCRPSSGYPCPYLSACWNAEVGSDPLASGLYTRRVPHHEVRDDMA